MLSTVVFCSLSTSISEASLFYAKCAVHLWYPSDAGSDLPFVGGVEDVQESVACVACVALHVCTRVGFPVWGVSIIWSFLKDSYVKMPLFFLIKLKGTSLLKKLPSTAA